MNEQQKNDDLHWRAFEYVSGALAADERAAFEDRLATDQEAREAVAMAVELEQTVSAALTQPLVSVAADDVSNSPHGRGHWIAVVGAVGLLALLFTVGLGLRPAGDRDDLTRSSTTSTASSAELAMIWGDLLEDEEATITVGEVAVSFGEVTASFGEVEPLEGSPEEELNTQDWMVAALASMEQAEESQD